MAKFPKIISMRGTAAYAWLDKADDKYDAEKPKYKVTLVVDAGPELDKFRQSMDSLADEVIKRDGLDVPEAGERRSPIKDGTEYAKKLAKKAKKKGEDMDPENHPFFGKMYIETSSKFKPGQVGPDRKALEGGTIIMSGDIIKFSALVKPYEAFEGGVSLQLRNVQLIEKMSGAGDPSDDFDDETDGHDGSDADDDTDF